MPSDWIKKLAIAFAGLALLYLAVLLFALPQIPKPMVSLSEQSMIEQVDIVQKKDGLIRWHIRADNAYFLPDNNIKINKLWVDFPAKNLEVHSDSGFYNTVSKKLEIEGNIEAKTGSLSLKAEKLLWDAVKNELYTDKQITISSQKFTLQGQGLKTTPDKAILQNNVKAVFDGG